MKDLETAEYEALRATIRERGSVRICTIVGGLTAWGALAVLLHLVGPPLGGAVLIPLVVLAAAHEASFFIHTGVERVGRYLQVFYEEANDSAPAPSRPGWETIAMRYGSSFPGGGDPLLTGLFHAGIAVNFLNTLALIGGHPAWAVLTLAAHGAVAYRIVISARAASTQRAIDLERMRSLARSTATVDPIQKP